MTYFWFTVLIVLWVLYKVTDDYQVTPSEKKRSLRSGWVYFISDGNGAIKVGMCVEEPLEHRLPDLQVGNPRELKLEHKMWVTDRYRRERQLHHELASYHIRGEWYAREPVLAYIAHLKGEW